MLARHACHVTRRKAPRGFPARSSERQIFRPGSQPAMGGGARGGQRPARCAKARREGRPRWSTRFRLLADGWRPRAGRRARVSGARGRVGVGCGGMTGSSMRNTVGCGVDGEAARPVCAEEARPRLRLTSGEALPTSSFSGENTWRRRDKALEAGSLSKTAAQGTVNTALIVKDPASVTSRTERRCYPHS